MAGRRDSRKGSTTSLDRKGKGISQRSSGGRLERSTQIVQSGLFQSRAAEHLLEGRPHVSPGQVEVAKEQDGDLGPAWSDGVPSCHSTKLFRRETIDVERNNGVRGA